MKLSETDLETLLANISAVAEELGAPGITTSSMVFEFSRLPDEEGFGLYLCTENIGTTYYECAAAAAEIVDYAPFGQHNMDYPERLEGAVFSREQASSREILAPFERFARKAGTPHVKPLGWHGEHKERYLLWLGHVLGEAEPDQAFRVSHWSKIIAKALDRWLDANPEAEALKNVVLYYELENSPLSLSVNNPSLEVSAKKLKAVVASSYGGEYLDGTQVQLPIGEQLVLSPDMIEELEWFFAQVSARLESGKDFADSSRLATSPVVIWACHEMESQPDLSLRDKAKRALAKRPKG